MNKITLTERVVSAIKRDLSGCSGPELQSKAGTDSNPAGATYQIGSGTVIEDHHGYLELIVHDVVVYVLSGDNRTEIIEAIQKRQDEIRGEMLIEYLGE